MPGMSFKRTLGFSFVITLALWSWFSWPLPRYLVSGVPTTALLGIALPFRWINLFGGSPAGFAMAWIPAILLGVDLAVREDRIGGGILAGAAIFLASWTDKYVFFFGTLAAPVWGAMAFAARSDFQWRRSASYQRIVWALLPIGLFAAAAFLFPSLMKGLYRTVMGLAPVAHDPFCPIRSASGLRLSLAD